MCEHIFLKRSQSLKIVFFFFYSVFHPFKDLLSANIIPLLNFVQWLRLNVALYKGKGSIIIWPILYIALVVLLKAQNAKYVDTFDDFIEK